MPASVTDLTDLVTEMLTPSEGTGFGFWIDLTSIKMDDLGSVTWLQAMPLGTYQHPTYGEINITPERVQRFASNVKANVRGQDLNIDYDHVTGKAAGWVKDADARSDGLYLAVQWTPDAHKMLSNKEYRYFSPEFVDSWTHPQTKQKHADVVFGGALTNRPFLKGILPINLSEVIQDPQGAKGGKPVALSDKMKAVAKTLGLPDDTSEDALAGALEAKFAQPDPPKVVPPVKEEVVPSPTPEKVPVAASETLKKLAETNPEVAKMISDQEATNKRLAELETANKLSEINLKLAELDSGKFIVPPTVKDELRSVMLGEKKGIEVYDVLKKLAEVGLVEKGERGRARTENNAAGPVKQFSDAVDAKMKSAGNMTYADAVSLVSAENPQLFEEYREASFANEERGVR